MSVSNNLYSNFIFRGLSTRYLRLYCLQERFRATLFCHAFVSFPQSPRLLSSIAHQQHWPWILLRSSMYPIHWPLAHFLFWYVNPVLFYHFVHCFVFWPTRSISNYVGLDRFLVEVFQPNCCSIASFAYSFKVFQPVCLLLDSCCWGLSTRFISDRFYYSTPVCIPRW